MLWAAPDLQRPPSTQLDTSWSHLKTLQKHRKTTRLDRKCVNQQVVPGIFQSSQAAVLELWALPDLLQPPETQLDTS